MNWKQLELALKCADLVASDRKAHNRDSGHAGEMRRQCEAGLKALAESLRKINRTIDAFIQ